MEEEPPRLHLRFSHPSLVKEGSWEEPPRLHLRFSHPSLVKEGNRGTTPSAPAPQPPRLPSLVKEGWRAAPGWFDHWPLGFPGVLKIAGYALRSGAAPPDRKLPTGSSLGRGVGSPVAAGAVAHDRRLGVGGVDDGRTDRRGKSCHPGAGSNLGKTTAVDPIQAASEDERTMAQCLDQRHWIHT